MKINKKCQTCWFFNWVKGATRKSSAHVHVGVRLSNCMFSTFSNVCPCINCLVKMKCSDACSTRQRVYDEWSRKKDAEYQEWLNSLEKEKTRKQLKEKLEDAWNESDK